MRAFTAAVCTAATAFAAPVAVAWANFMTRTPVETWLGWDHPGTYDALALTLFITVAGVVGFLVTLNTIVEHGKEGAT